MIDPPPLNSEELAGRLEVVAKWFTDREIIEALKAGAAALRSSRIEREKERGDDRLYSQAVDMVITSQAVSVSAIQRRLRIGFSQAAGYIDEMQALGIVSAPDQVGRRTVLVADQSTLPGSG